MRRKTFFAGFILIAAFLAFVPILANAQEMTTAENAYSFSFTGIDGKPMPLNQYRGKVLLIVNTASECGFTPQYADLEKLYEAYKDQGLIVIGVPSDNFGGQEPAGEKDIRKFTSEKFHISFPLTAKTDVVGDKRHPFYVWAGNQGKGGLFGHLPLWNFHKYLIGRDGQLIDGFSSPTSPVSSGILDAVQAALKQKAP